MSEKTNEKETKDTTVIKKFKPTRTDHDNKSHNVIKNGATKFYITTTADQWTLTWRNETGRNKTTKNNETSIKSFATTVTKKDTMQLNVLN